MSYKTILYSDVRRDSYSDICPALTTSCICVLFCVAAEKYNINKKTENRVRADLSGVAHLLTDEFSKAS